MTLTPRLLTRLVAPLVMAILLVAAPRPAPASRYVFVDEPRLEFAEEGQVWVRWTSAEPMPPGRIVYGITLPADPWREPRFRMIAREKGDSLRSVHEAQLRLRTAQRPVLDAAQHRMAGGGEITLRLELYDLPRRFLYTRYFRFAYRSDEDLWRRVPCIRSGPWIDRVGPRQAWLSWELDLPAPVRLSFGPAREDPAAWETRIIEAAGKSELPLTGLEPETRYGYRQEPLAEDGGALPARVWEFKTAPELGRWPADGSVRIAFMSDSRGGASGMNENVSGTNRKMIRRLMIQAELAGADLICFGGDLVDGFTDRPEHIRHELAAWKLAAECVGPRLPIYEGMGNHEMLADDFSEEGKSMLTAYRDRSGPVNSESVFAEAFVNPVNGPPVEPGRPPFLENVYSFDVGLVHVVSLNSTYDVSSDPDSLGGYREGWIPDEQLAWLEADLTAAREAGQKEILVFTHEPAFPCGGHAADAMYWNGEIPEVLAMRERFWGILMHHGVRAALFGDEHNYSRLRVDERVGDHYRVPVWHIVSGGVGAPYYARDETVPWAGAVSAFSTEQHFCLFELSEVGVVLTVHDSFGRVIDRAVLD